MNSSATTIDVLTLLVSAIGLTIIWYQLRQSGSSAKATLILQINRDLNSYSDIGALLAAGSNLNLAEELNALQRERLLDYISYFEGIYISYQRGLFSLSEINDYFAGRFFRLCNNTGVQQSILLNSSDYSDIFRPIFKLHAALSSYRSQRNYAPILLETDLAIKSGEIYDNYTKS